MIKYRVFANEIIAIEFTRQEGNTYFFIAGGEEHAMEKVSNWNSIYDTWEEARQHILKQKYDRIAELKRNIMLTELEIEKIKKWEESVERD